MWYLVIPPIIIVFCLALLLWYLSRKGSDPTVLAKIAREGVPEKKEAFLRTKNFFLKLLEKMTQRFKIRTLKMHNAVGTWSQSLRKKREIVGELAAQQKQAASEKNPGGVIRTSRLQFWKHWQKEARPKAEEIQGGKGENEILQELVIQRRQQGAPASGAFSENFQAGASESEENLRPMVSETVTEPEVRRKRQRPNVTHEETLIERIAENPKDFTAYEALGDYYMSVENTRDAKECYRQVLKLRPVHRLVKIKIRRLEKILTDKS